MANAKQDPVILEIDGIPTAAGLASMGNEYARRVPGGIRITDEGHALLGQKLRQKARDDLAKGIRYGVAGTI